MKSIREMISLPRLSILAVPFFVGAALLAPVDSTHTAGLLGAGPAACAEIDGCMDEAFMIFDSNIGICEDDLECVFNCSEDFESVTSWQCHCYLDGGDATWGGETG